MDHIETEHPLHSTENGRTRSQRNSSSEIPQSSFQLQHQSPQMGSRGGSVSSVYRDGPGNAGGSGNDGGAGGADGSGPAQTPTQDISSAMVEASQEIRQLREQQTQEAMTDRVKRLSKTSDNSADKDRFVRSMSPYQPMADGDMGSSSSSSSSASSSLPGQYEELVRQIALRVSQKLREAQERGDVTADYHSMLAQEIAESQLAGILPGSPA
ncbi:hypothetical protein BGZ49_002161 [Haplosporangium sp. Z 27]|nr:hypothetical protein BGZ49_002161 [Haplosporangium sp. Z 27]